jgi:hypothetical protein
VGARISHKYWARIKVSITAVKSFTIDASHANQKRFIQTLSFSLLFQFKFVHCHTPSHGATTFTMATPNIKALSIIGLKATPSNETLTCNNECHSCGYTERHYAKYVYANCHYTVLCFAECHLTECYFAQCHSEECHFSEYHFAEYPFAEYPFAEYPFAEYHFTECHFTDCRSSKCCCADCRGTLLIPLSFLPCSQNNSLTLSLSR